MIDITHALNRVPAHHINVVCIMPIISTYSLQQDAFINIPVVNQI